MSDSARPFDALRDVLDGVSVEPPEAGPAGPGGALRIDPDRRQRTGIPEVVYAAHKPPEMVLESLIRLADANGRALASRCPAQTIAAVDAALAGPDGGRYGLEVDEIARAVVLRRGDAPQPVTGGRIGILAAGSSDAPAAAEAALMAREMGASADLIVDVGVAGLHRLARPLERLVADGVDAIVVAAGMDGALPSVVAGLVAVPVIGLPTSVGYGLGGQGVGALLAMLQSCAPGLSVVNIDNGIGAGATAALIANRMASARARR